LATDWLLERGGFEPPVSREVIMAEKGMGIGDILSPRFEGSPVENKFALHSVKFPAPA
jgi:hypothetical protein